jgi:hypothetical protein
MLSVTMRLTHAAGEGLFVDYAGDGVPVVIDRLAGESLRTLAANSSTKRRRRSVDRSWLRRPNPHAANQSSDRRLTAGGLRTLWPAHPVVGHPIGRHDRLNALRNGLPRRRAWACAKEDGRIALTSPSARRLRRNQHMGLHRIEPGTARLVELSLGDWERGRRGSLRDPVRKE